jgi:isopentenyl diphosphate isomerase/L-lactate dehydrogenase-like FMN-dependent dehydrogenase
MMLVNVADARQAARRRLPKIFFDYIDGGAASEATLRANEADFVRWRLEQSVLTGITAPDLSTDYLGARRALPFMLGPVGFLGLYAGNGEVLAARAAAAANIPFCLSSFSVACISRVAREALGESMFQLYVLKDRALGAEMLRAAREAGVETIFLTVDCAITAMRERDLRNGFRALTRLTPGLLARLSMHPGWCLDMLRHGMPQVEALAAHPEFGRGVLAQAAALSSRIDQSLSWADLAWVRENWPGRLVLKGILSAADAREAQAMGADAIVISNHGGRQLDGAASTVAMLPEIAAAVPGLELLIDSGFRRGADIVKALGLGASGVLLGRAYAYALAAAGQAGVARIIEALTKEIEISLALMGCGSIEALKAEGPRFVRPA